MIYDVDKNSINKKIKHNINITNFLQAKFSNTVCFIQKFVLQFLGKISLMNNCLLILKIPY